jgi:hypothetical protein
MSSWVGILHNHSLVCRSQGGGFGVPSGPLRGYFSARKSGDIYQFGVAEGHSLSSLLDIYPGVKAWAFDTFQGMPSAEKDEPTFDMHWRRGQFRPAKAVNGVEVASQLPQLGKHAARVRTVVGPFKESLVAGLAAQRGMEPAVYIDIDADLYSSSKQALDWLFREGLVVKGTVIGYDDYWDLACKHASTNVERYGEARAHAEMAAKYNVEFKCVCGPCAQLPSRGSSAQSVRPWGWRTYFVVVSIGERVSSGLELSHEDTRAFLNAHLPCRGLWDRNASHWLGIS